MSQKPHRDEISENYFTSDCGRQQGCAILKENKHPEGGEWRYKGRQAVRGAVCFFRNLYEC